jgi:hypothetical protein
MKKVFICSDPGTWVHGVDHRPSRWSQVMNKYKSSSATVGVWTLGAWGLESDVFTLSCLPAFLILIPVPVFPSFPPFPSVFKNRGPASRWWPPQKKGEITKRTQFKNI